MFGNGRQRPRTLGQYDYGNGRSGTHPIRRNRFLPGPPPWVQRGAPLVEPVVTTANEVANRDDLHGERDRSFESQMADLEVWE